MMWKILTAQIWEEIFYSLKSRGLFPEEKKFAEKDPEATLHISTHPKWDQDQTEKYSYVLDWPQ